MVTPVMIARIGWGTYLFFAVVNASFVPLIYFAYPETKRRSLEEIDLIFAKGWMDGKKEEGEREEKGKSLWWRGDAYVRAAREMPFLSDEEVEAEARRRGLVLEGEAEAEGEKALRMRSVGDEEGNMDGGEA